jgi:hypothetical protein
MASRYIQYTRPGAEATQEKTVQVNINIYDTPKALLLTLVG